MKLHRLDANTPNVIRVLHLIPHLKNVGNGIVNSTVDLAAEQSQAGMSVFVASRDGEYKKVLRDVGVECLPLDAGMNSIVQIRRIVKEIKPTVIHCHTPRALLLARFCFPFRRIIATAHNEFSKTTLFLMLASKIIAVSEQNRDSIIRWAGKGRVSVVRNGIIGGIRSKTSIEAKPVIMKHPAILFVGGMYERKGVEDLLVSFNSVLKCTSIQPMLYLVGAGPDQNQFERLVETLNLEACVRFIGFVRNTNDYMTAADIFVLPSRKEPFGLVLAEARVAGCAIIATSVGGIPEVLDHGEAGILVESGDIKGLSDAILKLVTDQSERQSWAKKAAENTDWLSIRRVMEETNDIYREYAVQSL